MVQLAVRSDFNRLQVKYERFVLRESVYSYVPVLVINKKLETFFGFCLVVK